MMVGHTDYTVGIQSMCAAPYVWVCTLAYGYADNCLQRLVHVRKTFHNWPLFRGLSIAINIL